MLISFAYIRAQEVLPTPLGPQKRIADGILFSVIEFFRVLVTLFCPITVSKLFGLYFSEETTKSFISTNIIELIDNIENNIQNILNLLRQATLSLFKEESPDTKEHYSG